MVLLHNYWFVACHILGENGLLNDISNLMVVGYSQVNRFCTKIGLEIGIRDEHNESINHY